MSDPRYAGTMQLFYTQLANRYEGWEASQKNLWLQDKLHSIREMNSTQPRQQGR